MLIEFFLKQDLLWNFETNIDLIFLSMFCFAVMIGNIINSTILSWLTVANIIKSIFDVSISKAKEQHYADQN